MKKCVVTLNVGNYIPEICALTYPMMKLWANKIGAEWIEITEQKFADTGLPLNVEKFQLSELSAHYDYTYFLDCDALVLPDAPDWAEQVNDKSIVLFNGVDNRLDRFKASNYSRRSGSRIGACTWNVICSDWTGPDLWRPPTDWSVCSNITLLWSEAKTGNCQQKHLIDDYQLSENIARYGLKVSTINQICKDMGRENQYYEHLYNIDSRQKLLHIRNRLDIMGIAY